MANLIGKGKIIPMLN